MTKLKIETESYPDQLCKLYSFKEEKARYRKHYLPWDKINRANKKVKPVRQKSFFLSSPANKLLSAVMGKLIKGERVLLNHKYISTFTFVERRQNVRIIEELEDILNITYHNSITYNGQKYRYSYEFYYKQQNLGNTACVENSVETFMSQQNDPLYIYENKDIEDIDLKSNFLQNPEDSQSTTNCHLLKIQSPEVKTPPIETVKFKKRLSNKRKKSTNAERKARIYRFNQYKEPKDLGYHYPLTKDDGEKLQRLSGRDFSLNAMNEILLDMSKRLDNRFCSKAQFMAYFGKCLRFEMRDVVKTGNDNFYIKANVTPINQKAITKAKQIEQYLAEVEQKAISHVCPENQLKARIANVLEPLRSYELLSNIKDFEVVGSTARIYLRAECQLNRYETNLVLSQFKSIYSGLEVDIESVEYLVENVCKQVNGYDEVRTKATVVIPTLQQGIWGDICRHLIETFGIHVYNNWFSKLTPVIDEQNRTIELKAPNLFVKQWVETNYGDTIQEISKNLRFDLKVI